MYKFFFICCLTTALALPEDNSRQHNTAASVNSAASIPTLTIPKFLQDALKQKQQLQANTAVSQPGPQQQQYQTTASSINPGQQLSQQQQQQSIQQQLPSQQQQIHLQPQQSQIKQSQQQPLLQQLASAQNFLPLQSARSLQQQQPAIISQQHQYQFPSLLQQQQQQQFSQFPSQAQLINHHTQSGPVVTKDIYVHIPPFDNEQQQHHLRQQQQNLLPPRKHYRIVFIKAPTPDTKSNAVHLTEAPIEEKTIIYVLSKKPDSTQLHASIQESLAKYKPSKPEVYFIKYKTTEEAQHAQRTIQAQYDKLGGTTQISDEGVAPVTSVIGSLDVRSGDNNNLQATASR